MNAPTLLRDQKAGQMATEEEALCDLGNELPLAREKRGQAREMLKELETPERTMRQKFHQARYRSGSPVESRSFTSAGYKPSHSAISIWLIAICVAIASAVPFMIFKDARVEVTSIALLLGFALTLFFEIYSGLKRERHLRR